MQNTGAVFLYKPPENGGELEADLRILQPLTSGTALPKRIWNLNSLRADELWAMSFLLYSYCFWAPTFPPSPISHSLSTNMGTGKSEGNSYCICIYSTYCSSLTFQMLGILFLWLQLIWKLKCTQSLALQYEVLKPKILIEAKIKLAVSFFRFSSISIFKIPLL